MKWISYIMLAAIMALGFAACGMNGQEPSSATGGITNSPADSTDNPVGMIECIGCHADEYNPASLANVVGDSADSSGWINGPHANNNNFPDYGYFSDDTCATCHDQLGDGETIADIESLTGLDMGSVDRPVVSCESCHGSGADHFGTGPVEYTRPGAARCGQCHNETFDHNVYHPTGDEIYEKYTTSKHGTSINDHNYEDAEHTQMRALCSKCHTDEGAQIYKDVEGGHDELVTLFTDEPVLDSTTVDVSDVQCRTCHNPHNPDEYLEEDTTDILGNVVASGQYNTCINCHQMSDSYHGEDNGHSWSGPYPFDLGIGDFVPAEIIYDTHMDNPDTAEIEGYVIDAAADNACSSCHDVHEAETSNETGEMSINEQWARSKHGGHILDKKDIGFANIVSSVPAEAIANLTALINGTDTTGSVLYDESSFAHYNFITGFGGACRRCHTSSGFKYMAETGSQPFGPTSLIGYATTGDQREMVYCWACHQSIADDLRGDAVNHATHKRENSLIFNSISPYAEPADRIDAVENLEGSNVCMACHSGRASGQDIVAIDSNPVDTGFTNTSFVNAHYLTAGGILFRTVGYEPSVETYDDPVGFAHGTIGTTEGVSWGDNGPCIACHMKHEEGHTMEAVEFTGGLISNIPAYENTCSLCHNPSKTDLATFMDDQKAGFTNALEHLEVELAARGLHYYGDHPYIYASAYDPVYIEIGNCTDNQPTKNWQTGGSNTYSWIDTDPPNLDYECVSDYPAVTPGTSVPPTGANNMGAAFVYVLLEHEPGAYVHNSLYTKRLIYDSIDWLDDNIMNGSTTVIEPAYTYLNGGIRP